MRRKFTAAVMILVLVGAGVGLSGIQAPLEASGFDECHGQAMGYYEWARGFTDDVTATAIANYFFEQCMS